MSSAQRQRWTEAEVGRVTGQPQRRLGPQKDKEAGEGRRRSPERVGGRSPRCCSFDGAASPAVLEDPYQLATGPCPTYAGSSKWGRSVIMS